MSQLAIWGWDLANNKWVKVLVDSLGHVQVDVLSSALPTGAATYGMQNINNQLTSLSYVVLNTRLPAALAAVGGLKVVDLFVGDTYVNSDTATDDNARRFETSAKKLRGGIIIVKTYAQLFGDSSNQTYPVAVDEVIGFGKLDISTLYFKNATADEDGTVHILGAG